jgi:putative addiction module CopG family antidote
MGRLRDGVGWGNSRIEFSHGFYTLAVKMLNCSWLAEIHHEEKGTSRNTRPWSRLFLSRDDQVCLPLRVFYTAVVTPIIEIRLPAALEKFIASQVREGRYRSREAAIVAAVRHLKQRSEQLVWLRSEIQNGLDSGPGFARP